MAPALRQRKAVVDLKGEAKTPVQEPEIYVPPNLSVLSFLLPGVKSLSPSNIRE